jgi:hyperosmotically inducible periplasmic protein
MMFKDSMLAAVLVTLIFAGACSSARRTGSTVKDATVATGREVGDKTEDAAEVVADKTADAAEGLAETTADATITSAVKMKFAADKTVEALAIDVDTNNGNVTLTGTVKSKAEADKAVLLARGVEGVKSVTPKLTIATQ